MDFAIDAIVASKVGFASHQNAVPILRDLKIRLTGEQSVECCQLKLTSDPPFVQPKTWRIERISPGDELVVSDRELQLNAALLGGLTESLIGKITLTLELQDSAELAQTSGSVELLAHNEWGGLSSMAELLPAFVMPNDPAVDRVLKAASDALRSAGKPHELDGYRSKDRGRVWQVASAIWSAVAGLRLSYALPPASFERVGQKVRTPGAVLEGRIATCLDTALLFAAALEQAGLNPLLILTKGHALAGVWLQPVEFSNLITDEAAALRRRLDLDDLQRALARPLPRRNARSPRMPMPFLKQPLIFVVRACCESGRSPSQFHLTSRRTARRPWPKVLSLRRAFPGSTSISKRRWSPRQIE
jgi:hypothetical protein